MTIEEAKKKLAEEKLKVHTAEQVATTGYGNTNEQYYAMNGAAASKNTANTASKNLNSTTAFGNLGVNSLGLSPNLSNAYNTTQAVREGKDKDVVEAASQISKIETSKQNDVDKKVGGDDFYYYYDGGNDVKNTPGFTPSNTYQQAMEYTNQLLEQLSAGRTSYTDKINALMGQIEGRAPFSYDMDTDTLFQNSLASAMNSGQIAMQDTMGQAAALTGGYGSTYATSAANQAYNGYIQDAYSQLPDYYQLAMDAYNMEGNNLATQLSMYQTADDAEYSRLANAYSANAQAAANLYDQEYNNYWQQKSSDASAASAANENYWKQLELYGKYGVLGTEDGGISVDSSMRNTNSNGSKMYNDTQFQNALALAISGGTEDGSDYMDYLWELQQMGYDISTLDHAIERDEDYIDSQKKKQRYEWYADAEGKKNGKTRASK